MKIVKVLGCITILIFIFFNVFNYTNAVDNPGKYKPTGPTYQEMSETNDVIGLIAGVVQVAGTIISVAVLMVIGIRYMISSAEEKAEYKERLFPYFVGAVILFAASNLVNALYKFGQGLA